MRTFTGGFTSTKNKKSSEPVNLLKIDWPASSNLPAKTLRLSDCAIAIDGVDWLPLVEDWGTIVADEKTRIQLIQCTRRFRRGAATVFGSVV